MKKITTLLSALMISAIGFQSQAQMYSEDFESGAGGWTTAGGGSFALGTPANTIINSASSGTNAWVTNLTGEYSANEDSQVESPVIDLSGTTNPEIHVKIWWETEFSWDGMVLQSSINGGTSWQTIGALGDPNNWYTDNSINANPGGQQQGWSGRNGTGANGGSNGWVTARHDISSLNTQANVTFRFAFSADGSGQDEGVAFDDFEIYDITCPQPLALGDSNITAFTADLFWTEAGTATAWEIELDTAGFAPTGIATNTGISITGFTANPLLSSTSYDYYVRAICGPGDSSVWSGPHTFTTDVTCPQPIALGDSNITAYTADLFWTEGASATQWQVQVDTTGFTPGTSNAAIDSSLTNPYFTASTLMPNNTNYQYYVRAVCGAGDSSLWSGPYNFSTLCVNYIAPFYEGFDEPSTPGCWSQSANTGGPWVFGQLGSAGYAASSFEDHTGNGGYYAWMDFSGTDDSVMFELPVIDISASSDFELNFSLASHNTGGNDSNFLYVQAWNGTDWSQIAAIQQDSSEWINYNYDLTAFTYGANLTKIRFVADRDTSATAIGNYFNNDLLIDDVRISEPCNIPTAGIGAALSTSSANVSWATSGASAATWSIEYGPTGFVQGTGNVINGTTLNPHPLVGLNDSTTYDFYIISNCALGDKSPWAGPFNFTTFITGVDESSTNNGVRLFPNPNNGIFSLEVNASDATVNVMNTQGQVILTKNILNNNAKIDLSNNAKGIYFVTVTSENGVSTHKVSVQ